MRSGPAPRLWIAALGAGLWAVASAAADPKLGAVDPSQWEDKEFLALWEPAPKEGYRAYSYLPRLDAFRGVPLRATTGQFSEKGVLECTTLLFFDAGYAYGFAPNMEEEEGGREAVVKGEVAAEYKAASEKAREILREMHAEYKGEKTAVKMEVGSGKKLKFPAVIAPVQGGAARLIDVPDRMVEISFFPDMASASRIKPDLSAEGVPLDHSYYASKVKQKENGDVLIQGIPMLHQGNRAYCAVSALAMAAQYFHINLGTEAYAAAAGFKNGNNVVLVNLFDTYEETVEATGFEFSHRIHLDFRRVRDSVINGFPVLVWRRYDHGRDRLHTTFARRFADDPSATLPAVDDAERSTWPIKGGYKHASLITGYNEQRGEIIFTEAWGEHARDRRMRIEEMEATSYLSFYPK